MSVCWIACVQVSGEGGKGGGWRGGAERCTGGGKGGEKSLVFVAAD